MNMVFSDLIKKINPVLLNERYYKYTFPAKKETQMYDFYVLDYLNTILDYASDSFRDLPMDLEDSIRDAVKTLFPTLREELLSAVLYALCAEIRHAETFSNGELFDKDTRDGKLYRSYLRYIKYHAKSVESQKELSDIYGVRKPSSEVRSPIAEVNNDRARNQSFRAAHFAIKNTKSTPLQLVEMIERLFRTGNWNADSSGNCSYGGPKWADIAKGWILLYNSDEINPSTSSKAPPKNIIGDLEKGIKTAENPNQKEKEEQQKKKRSVGTKEPMSVAIDHVYDLQHNNDTVFQKLKSYYGDSGGYSWILTTLDFKANIQSYFDLLSNASRTVQAMAPPTLYNKLGSTWEQYIKTNSPSEDFDIKDYELKKISHSATEEEIKNKFVTPIKDSVSQFIEGKPYKVYGYADGVLLLKDEKGKPQKLGTRYFNLLQKRDVNPDLKDLKDLPELSTGETWVDLKTWDDIKDIKVGDMVKCMQTVGVADSLTYGKLYAIVKLPQIKNGALLYVRDDKLNVAGYDSSRFVILQSVDIGPEQKNDDAESEQDSEYVSPVSEITWVQDSTPIFTKNKKYDVFSVNTQYDTMLLKADDESKVWVPMKDLALPNSKNNKSDLYAKCIKVGNNALIEVDHIYRVLEDNGDGTLSVINAHGTVFDYRKNYFGPPHEIAGFSTTKDNTKVGDTVICINYSSNEHLTLKGEYTVTGILPFLSNISNKSDVFNIQIVNDEGVDTPYYSSKFVKKLPTGDSDTEYVGKEGENPTVSTGQFHTFKRGDTVKCIDSAYSSGELTLNKTYTVVKTKGGHSSPEHNAKFIQVIDDFGDLSGYYSSRFELVSSPPSPQFKVGDKVECIDPGGYKIIMGAVYTVTTVDKGHNQEDYLGVKDSEGKFIGAYRVFRFKLVSNEDPNKDNPVPQKTTHRFHKGDKVKCIDAGDNTHITTGKVYEIITVLVHYFEIVSDDGAQNYYFKNRFEPYVEEAPNVEDKPLPFKTGDMAECVDNGDNYYSITIGKQYEVIKCFLGETTGKGVISIKNDKGTIADYYADRFKLSSPLPPPLKKNPFKEGDMVKCIDAGGNSYISAGSVYEIIQGGDNTITIIGDTGIKFSYSYKLFEPYDGKPKVNPFKQGDKVKCISVGAGNDFISVGKLYEVNWTSNNTITIVGDDEHDISVDYNLFEPADDKPSQLDTLKNTKSVSRRPAVLFRKGDIVECVDSDGWGVEHLTVGKQYEVLEYHKSPSGFTNDDTISFIPDSGMNSIAGYANRFKLVKSAKKPKSTSFKVGDIVECISGKTEYLSSGDHYEVLEVKGNKIMVESDIGKPFYYNIDMFKSSDIYPSPESKRKPESSTKEKTKLKVGDSVSYKVVGTVHHGEIIDFPSPLWATVKGAKGKYIVLIRNLRYEVKI